MLEEGARGDGRVAQAKYRVAFVVEQNLGHRTHYKNLQRYVGEDPFVLPSWLPVAHDTQGLLYSLPVFRSNMSVQLSTKAWRAIARDRRAGSLDAVFYHTQTPSLLAQLHRRLPTVISLDATPKNYDAVGEAYGHRAGGPLELVKERVYRSVFAHADSLITWSRWAKQSLESDYGVPAKKISVIAPGVDLALWPRRARGEPLEARGGNLPKLLFVGGDFRRKGGEDLLESFRGRLDEKCELHIVTQDHVEAGRNLYVYNDVTPNSEALLRLYAAADLFVFPTLADCFAQVVPEAMAASLPVVTTRVGATPEIVAEGVTGLLVQPRDPPALCRAIETLLAHPERRAEMGEAGRHVVERECDVRVNVARVLEVIKAATDRRR
jgi:glycosyltransferase involved in cell wall biosynthesis